MKMISLQILSLSFLLMAGCSDSSEGNMYTDDPISSTNRPQEGVLDEAARITWNFTDKEGWVTSNQGNDPIVNDEIVDHPEATDGKALRIWTRAQTYERKKVRTVQQYGAGRYVWRTKITDLLPLERASIGSWLWHDDRHEIDFEVGSGTAGEREAMGLGDDQVIAYITSQANPALSEKVPITKNAWHIFEIDLKLVNGNYLATWIIDGATVAQVQLAYGEDFPFYIFCSVENLQFTGDFIPSQMNEGFFDYVSYTPYTYSEDPTTPETPTDPIDPDPMPEPGEALRWGFDGSDIPSGWSRSTNVGEDAIGMLTVSDGMLRARVVQGYPESNGRMNLRYNSATTLGTYSWNVVVPDIEPNGNFMTGGQLMPSEDQEGLSVTIDIMWGSDAVRASQNAADNEVLVRASSEFFDAVAYAKVEIGTEHLLSIRLGTTDAGTYSISWLLDGAVMATRYNAPVTFNPTDVKLNMMCITQNNWGWYNTWYNGHNITREHVGLFDYAEFVAPAE